MRTSYYRRNGMTANEVAEAMVRHLGMSGAEELADALYQAEGKAAVAAAERRFADAMRAVGAGALVGDKEFVSEVYTELTNITNPWDANNNPRRARRGGGFRVSRSRYGFRRNPGMSASEIAAIARGMGMDELADLLEEGGPIADMLANEINAAVGEDEEVTVEDTALTDTQAWNMLADLVPTALSDQPKALQDALVAAFREEARRAA
jgi:hypothetical protein